MTFAEARARFPLLERVAFLNAGSMGPLSRATVAAVEAAQRRDADLGRGSRRHIEEVLEARTRVRAALAALLRVEAEQVALTGSTSDSCRIVVAGLGLGPGDEVVTTDSEHFGLVGPLHASGATVRVAPVLGRRRDEALAALLEAVTPRTRLLALQHVSWFTGELLPIDELQEATGLPLLVDGAQSAGAIPVDASRYDFYTVSAQKWLCGPDGTGALVVRDPQAVRVALPSYFAQVGYEPDGSFTARPGAGRHDWGWLGLPALAGLETALAELPEWGYERAAAMTARCRELLGARFDLVAADGGGTLVSIRLGDDAAADAVARAAERGVIVRDLPGTGLVRASCGYWTNEDDLERLVEALA
ncbi:MAG: aminotransferase class V-fold PLP-dependent enzyme [Thermoleophilia bacterium]|nr:aminotransferase class V-fold PLP-dependent enzyme [Thermoleophilia bacterium]